MKTSISRTGSVLLAVVCLGLIGLPARAAEGPETFKVSELTFKRPAAWPWVKSTSSMRAAELSIPGEGEGKDGAEVVFFYFGPGNGGGTQANVDRWFGQFRESKEEIHAKVDSKTTTAGNHKVTYVRAEGTFMSGPPFGEKIAKPGYGLTGAIVEHPRGNVFVKMTGPAELVKASAKAFEAMIEGATP